MPVQIKKDKTIFRLMLFCVTVGILSLVMFLPSMRELIISLGERYCGRPLTHSAWNLRFISWECEFLFLDAVAIGFLYLSKKNFSVASALLLLILSIHKLSLISTAHFGDYYGQWTLCAYTLHGCNP